MSFPQYPAALDSIPVPQVGEAITAKLLNDMYLLTLAVEGVIGIEGAKRTASSVVTRLGIAFNTDGRWKHEVLGDISLAWYAELSGNTATNVGKIRWMTKTIAPTTLTTSISPPVVSHLSLPWAVYHTYPPLTGDKPRDRFQSMWTQVRGTNTAHVQVLGVTTQAVFILDPLPPDEASAGVTLAHGAQVQLRDAMAAHSIGSTFNFTFYSLHMHVIPRDYPNEPLYAGRPYYSAGYA